MRTIRSGNHPAEFSQVEKKMLDNDGRPRVFIEKSRIEVASDVGHLNKSREAKAQISAFIENQRLASIKASNRFEIVFQP